MSKMVDRILSVALHENVRGTKKYDGYYEDKYTEEIKRSKEMLILDVGGQKFQVWKATFAAWPTTRLSCLIRAKSMMEKRSLCDGYYPSWKSQENKCEYFFNRNWASFNSILDIYRCGKLHYGGSSCPLTFQDDLEYWGFNDLFLEPCCAIEYFVEKATCDKEYEGERLNRKQK